MKRGMKDMIINDNIAKLLIYLFNIQEKYKRYQHVPYLKVIQLKVQLELLLSARNNTYL